MKQNDLQRLIKIEDRIKQYVEEYGMKCLPVEFDIVPPQKMIEILAYRMPTNISNWKYGRDYERLKTVFDTVDPNLPLELVVHDNPSRAFLMNSNTLAVQVLVMAHVYAHVNFFTESKWYVNFREDIVEVLAAAQKRFNDYERIYGLDEVEKTEDAGHALQWHSSPFNQETEMERKKRVFEQMKKKKLPSRAVYGDIVRDTKKDVAEDYDVYNNRLWRKILATTPIEPTEDILRFIIDNSRILEDWQKDILEILRMEGQYFWPYSKTKYMNEGWATYWHNIFMNRLFDEGLLTAEEHGQYNYSNSLVKATNKMGMNPYLVGSEMWKEIEERWNKGRYGTDYDNCTDAKTKENWDTKEMKGREKMFEVMRSYTDWFFMQDFLTVDLIDKLDLYIYQIMETVASIDYVRTNHTVEQVRELIINSFANSGIPKIEIVNGNLDKGGHLELVHRYNGIPLHKKYAQETLKHIYYLWGRPVTLKTFTRDKKTGKDKELYYTEDGTVSPPASSENMEASDNPFSTFHFDMMDLAPISL
ncbi:MAG TPA: SpoVR family protein [Bacteroidales bacterium]|nr:SpoVR family protein [Bacteroidales bacterium]